MAFAIEQAQRSVTSYYVLGYYTSNDAADGKLRHVSVSLPGHPEARVEWRRAFYGPKVYPAFTEADRESQLEDALRLEDPITDLPLSVEAHYFELSRDEYYVPVSVRLPGSEVARVPRRGKDRAAIQVIGEIRDKFGNTVRNLRDRIELKLDSVSGEQLAARALHYDCGFTLLPGSYRIKVLARDDASGRIGTSVQAFEVPNLFKERERVPISSVVLSRRRAAMPEALFTAGRDVEQVNNPLVKRGSKIIPNGSGVFRRADRLEVFLEAYESGNDAPRPLTAFLGLYRSAEQVAESRPRRFSGAIRGRLTVVALELALELRDFDPGRYLLQVTVLDPATSRASFCRREILTLP